MDDLVQRIQGKRPQAQCRLGNLDGMPYARAKAAGTD
jgi:hypothetical protein